MKTAAVFITGAILGVAVSETLWRYALSRYREERGENPDSPDYGPLTPSEACAECTPTPCATKTSGCIAPEMHHHPKCSVFRKMVKEQWSPSPMGRALRSYDRAWSPGMLSHSSAPGF